MSRLFRPGVYIEEISASPLPIPPSDTSTAAFLGETKFGPDTPTPVTSWQQFQTVFGGFFGNEKFLPYAVWGFFENGGVRCFVCRVTDGDYFAALAKLETTEPVSIVYSPNALTISGLADALIAHCEKHKRFCIFDALKDQAPVEVAKPRATSFAALYYPWIHVKPIGAVQVCLVPPGGHVAGIYTRTDNTVGIHKAPAAQVVKGAIGLEREVTQGQQDNLNPQGVNCIRSFVGRGILVWGARTLSDDAEFKYVNVRRLTIFLEESIQRGTSWVVFEANVEATWAKVRAQVEDFLMACWRKGMFAGATPQEAFFVRCDKSTMTQKDVAEGKLYVWVGVAVIRPAEFVILHISHKKLKQ